MTYCGEKIIDAVNYCVKLLFESVKPADVCNFRLLFLLLFVLKKTKYHNDLCSLLLCVAQLITPLEHKNPEYVKFVI